MFILKKISGCCYSLVTGKFSSLSGWLIYRWPGWGLSLSVDTVLGVGVGITLGFQGATGPADDALGHVVGCFTSAQLNCWAACTLVSIGGCHLPSPLGSICSSDTGQLSVSGSWWLSAVICWKCWNWTRNFRPCWPGACGPPWDFYSTCFLVLEKTVDLHPVLNPRGLNVLLKVMSSLLLITKKVVASIVPREFFFMSIYLVDV